MRPERFWRNAFIVLIALIMIGQSVFILDQREQGVVLRFGKPVRVLTTPGLQTKIPFAEQVAIFDRRNQAIQAEPEAMTTADQRQLMVDAFVRYQIEDPLRFYRALQDQKTAAARLNKLADTALRDVLVRAKAQDVLSGDRDALTRAALGDMERRVTAAGMGIKVIDLRIRRVELPPAEESAVFDRMSAAWRQEAALVRAGTEQQRQQILAKANAKAAVIRTQTATERAKIYASSYGRDPDFAAFYQTMRAYDETLAKGDTTVVLPADSTFLKYLQHGPQPANSSAR